MVQTSPAVFRLTVLWALCESALGGIMHALKIPFTGFFVGGFAAICIGIIAHYSQFSFRQIMQATLLVILVKSAVSPHSPVAAYFAVAFQGLFGAIIYCSIKNYALASVLFGFIALTESAIQKFILLTILFGKSVWQALDALVIDVLKIFSLDADFSFSFYLVGVYILIYALWGILIGWWIAKLPTTIATRSIEIISGLREIENKNTPSMLPEKKTARTHKFFWVVVFLSVITFVFINKNSSQQVIYVLLRTLAVLFMVFYVITPLLQWLLEKSSQKNKEAMDALVEQLPHVQKMVKPSWQLAKGNYKEFVFILLVAVLHNEET